MASSPTPSTNISTPNITGTILTPTTTQNATNPTDDPASGGQVGQVLAVLGTILLVLSLAATALWYFRKHGKPWISFTRVRRSSTSSSRHALENSGPADTMTSEGLGLEEEVNADMFAIEDDDEREDAEGYYYDEVFGQSPFRDQRTNSTTRYLTEDSNPGSTRDDVTRHDMDFETLGIKIDDYKIDPNLKYSI